MSSSIAAHGTREITGSLRTFMVETFLAMQSPHDVAALFGMDYESLAKCIYGTDDRHRYVAFEIPKRRGGVRTISAPCSKLKTIQRALSDVLYDIYVPRPSAHGFVRERNTMTNASRHMNKQLILNVDLKDFFGSIHFGRVKRLFMATPFSFPENVATVLAQICCFKNSLPQGAPTSPIIANMIARRLDGELQDLARRCNATYTRYADDLTFSLTCSVHRLPTGLGVTGAGATLPGPALVHIISANGFEIHPEKTRLASRANRMEVTGITVNEFPNVPRQYIRRLRSMLHAYERFGVEAAGREFHEKYDARHRASGSPKSMLAVIQGKLSYLRQVRGPADPMFLSLAARYNAMQPIEELRFRLDAPGPDGPHGESLWVLESCFDIPNDVAVHLGTAFAVNRTQLVTCAHCVPPEAGGSVELYQAHQRTRKEPVKVVARDQHRDVAVLELTGSNAPELVPMSVRTAGVRSRMNLTMLGFPNHRVGMRAHREDAVVVKRTFVESTVPKFEVSEQVRHGNSGGPIVDKHGHVAGIAVAGETDGVGVNAAVCSRALIEFLNDEGIEFHIK